jgi:hypothetical protein
MFEGACLDMRGLHLDASAATLQVEPTFVRIGLDTGRKPRFTATVGDLRNEPVRAVLGRVRQEDGDERTVDTTNEVGFPLLRAQQIDQLDKWLITCLACVESE